MRHYLQRGTAIHMSRHIKTAEELAQEKQQYQTKLATRKLLILYIRQSTKKQVLENLESHMQQALDLLEHGRELGWADDLIKTRNENEISGVLRNASGRLRIDEREGLQVTVEDIVKDEVGAVLVQDVSRLFRDEDGVEPRVFMQKCREHNVLVLLLDGDIYDFNHPQRDDGKRFCDDADIAASYLKQINKMNRLRHRKGMRGEFSGHGI